MIICGYTVNLICCLLHTVHSKPDHVKMYSIYMLHAAGRSVVDPNSFYSDSDPQIIFFGFGFEFGFLRLIF
jgi:hypothetical protein